MATSILLGLAAIRRRDIAQQRDVSGDGCGSEVVSKSLPSRRSSATTLLLGDDGQPSRRDLREPPYEGGVVAQRALRLHPRHLGLIRRRRRPQVLPVAVARVFVLAVY